MRHNAKNGWLRQQHVHRHAIADTKPLTCSAHAPRGYVPVKHCHAKLHNHPPSYCWRCIVQCVHAVLLLNSSRYNNQNTCCVLTSTLKVQTLKGCLLGVLLVCKAISERGNFCSSSCCPCISKRCRPPKTATLQSRRTLPPRCTPAVRCGDFMSCIHASTGEQLVMSCRLHVRMLRGPLKASWLNNRRA